jgi:O-antigen/teichoic acid export membrane protein
MRVRADGAVRVGLAAAIGGLLGLLLTTLVARTIGAAATANFTAYWSSMYFVVGALAGIQQEITRAAHPVGQSRTSTPLQRFALVLGAIVAVGVALLSLLWALPVFGIPDGWLVAPALAVAAAGYVFVTVVGGVLYGLTRWNAIAVLVVGDSLLRLVAVLVCLLFTTDVVALAWAVSLPFGLTLVVTWPYIRRGLAGSFAIDVPLGQLARNILKAVTGSLATAVLVSGTALAIVVTSADVDTAYVGAFVFAVVVVRAPIMVAVQALQSFLILRFRTGADRRRVAALVVAAILAAGALIALAAAFVGDPVLVEVLGDDFALGWQALVVIVASSALMGVLFVTGPYAIATNRHVVYASGWVVAAIASLGLLLLPIDFATRTSLALLVGPAAGALVHLVGLARVPSRADELSSR